MVKPIDFLGCHIVLLKGKRHGHIMTQVYLGEMPPNGCFIEEDERISSGLVTLELLQMVLTLKRSLNKHKISKFNFLDTKYLTSSNLSPLLLVGFWNSNLASRASSDVGIKVYAVRMHIWDLLVDWALACTDSATTGSLNWHRIPVPTKFSAWLIIRHEHALKNSMNLKTSWPPSKNSHVLQLLLYNH